MFRLLSKISRPSRSNRTRSQDSRLSTGRAASPREALSRAVAKTSLFESLESRTLLSGNGLTATFFNNMTLSGNSVHTQVDAQVNLAANNNAPAGGVNAWGWSSRWTGQVLAAKTETYTFYTEADSGARIWVNGQEIINDWNSHTSVTEDKGTIALTAGQTYNITVEYFHWGGPAEMQLQWSSPSTGKQLIPSSNLLSGSTSTTTPPPATGSTGGTGTSSGGSTTPTPVVGTGTGLNAFYFNNQTLSGNPAVSRVESQVNLSANNNAPAGGINAWGWSVRWSGQIQAQKSETYTFYTDADSGAHVWVNGQEIINDWVGHSAVTEDKGTIALTAGQTYSITVEYFHWGGPAKMALQWSSPSTGKQLVPTSALYAAGGVSASSGSGSSPAPTPTPPPAPAPVTPTPISITQTIGNGAIRISTNGRFFANANGTPFFYLADTAWGALDALRQPDMDTYLKARASQGFTVIQTSAITTSPTVGNAYGATPFINNNYSQPNPAFFSNVDYFVTKAASVGLTVEIMPLWGNFVNSSSRILNTSTAYNYGYFLGSRYKNNPNVMWMLGGDSDATDATSQAIWTSMAQGLRAGDGGNHLITYHPQGQRSSYTSLPPSTGVVDFDMVQSGHWKDSANYDLITAGYNAAAKPVLDGEANYEGIYNNLVPGDGLIDDYDVRKKSYWSVFAGGAGITYGDVNVYPFYEPGFPSSVGANTAWQTALNAPGANEMKYLENLTLSRPYFSRVPDQSLVVTSTLSGSDRIEATRDASGAYAFIYSASGQSFTVNMTKISGGRANAWWYNPRTGQASSAGSYGTGGNQSFTPPSSGYGNDWVLVLDDATKGYGAP